MTHRKTSFLLLSCLAVGIGWLGNPRLQNGAFEGWPTLQAAEKKKSKPGDAAGKGVKNPEVLVTINGEAISKRMFLLYLNEKLQGMPRQQAEQARSSPKVQTMLLQEMIDVTLLAQEARKLKLDRQEGVNDVKALQERQLFAQLAMQDFSRQQPAQEPAMREVYNKIVAEPVREFKARHILLKTEEEAKDIIQKLGRGKDFPDLAKQYSKDPTAANGGDLGWFEATEMVKPLSDAIREMSKGSYSQRPVQSPLGWHILQLEDSRNKTPPTFEQAKPRLGALVQSDMLAVHVAGLRKDAKLEVNESLLVREDATHPATPSLPPPLTNPAKSPPSLNNLAPSSLAPAPGL
ncbi:peptidyl-prolyl cis-trans isomerase C [Gammaproteobacteria bacterium]